jgi:hypothetical protein
MTEAKRSIWKQRGRRFATGLNVAAAIALAGALVVMANYLAYRHYARWDWSRAHYYELSGKTAGLLGGLQGELKVVVFFQKNHRHYEDVRALLQEYQYVAAQSHGLTFKIDYVDPDREMARVREMAENYDVREPNVVVFEWEGRRKYVEAKAIADYETSLEGGRVNRKLRGFRGEEAFSSAIQSVVQAKRPVVYFVAGHGERDLSDYGSSAGYAAIVRTIRRDNIDVRPLLLTAPGGVPEDSSALVVAGPDRKFSSAEADLLAAYLNRSGRLMVLTDPQTVTGLEGLLEDWGVQLSPDVVVGLTLTGRELVITRYGEHPVTRNLRNVTTMFYQPRSVEPAVKQPNADPARADKPRVVPLALTGPEGWSEADSKESPPRFDEGVDRRGPIAVAAAVEKGPVAGIQVELKPTRLVVIGDSYFVSNGALRGAVGGNVDFFMSALNWLLEREALMAVAPRLPAERHLDMSSRQIQLLFLLGLGALPAAVALLGVSIWAGRKR